MDSITLYGNPGWGSAIVEAQLVWYGLNFEFQPVGDLFEDADAAERLRAINPLAQVPTLVTSNGMVMTESAAITLWLADETARDDLVPGAGSAERAAFLRWLLFITSNLYPTYTYADDPSRFVQAKAAQAPFRAAVDDYAKRLYGILETAAGAPWFLGQRFSALDLYIAVLSQWRPRRDWYAEHTPRFCGIADAALALPALAAVWRRNFDGSAD